MPGYSEEEQWLQEHEELLEKERWEQAELQKAYEEYAMQEQKDLEERGRSSAYRNDIGEKYCVSCKKWKKPLDFQANKTRIDGLQTICRSCNTAYRRKSRARAREA